MGIRFRYNNWHSRSICPSSSKKDGTVWVSQRHSNSTWHRIYAEGTVGEKGMFQRTRIRLTIINSLVFIILIGVIAVVVYSYAHSRLYRDLNDDLLEAVERVAEPVQRSPLDTAGAITDRT